jgi:hypothetical protein
MVGEPILRREIFLITDFLKKSGTSYLVDNAYYSHS